MAHELTRPAKQVSVEQRDEITSKAFEADRELRAAVRVATGVWWGMAKQIYEVHQTRAWETLKFESLASYLADPEITISVAHFYEVSRAWEELVVKRGVEPARLMTIHPSKLKLVMPALTRGEITLDEALDKVEALSYRDLVDDFRNGSPRKELAAEDEPVKIQCPTCGNYYVPDEDDA